MIKKIIFISLIFITISNCSFDTRSGIWTNNEEIKKIVSNENKIKILFEEKTVNNKEFNNNYLLKTPLNLNKNYNSFSSNNAGPQFIVDTLKKKSKYKFSKIRYFDFFDPELIFENSNLIFFDKKGTIIKFNDTSKIIWTKNHYSKEEKKLLPILNFSSKNNLLVVTDNLANYYILNLKSGELIWKKNHKAIFVSEIKIDKDRFYVIDSNNKLNCFSLSNGSKIWEFDTDYDLIRSQKKVSIIYDNTSVYFNNTRGDIYSLNKENGNLIWVTSSIQGSDNFQSFLLKNSNLVLDENNLYFSNNKNTFFSLDKNTGIIEWTQNINSDLTPVISQDIIFSISSDGYLFIIEKNTGNIIRITDIFKGTKFRKKNITMSGFTVGTNKIYLSLNTGKILQIDISSGKMSSIMKISNGKISKPFINEGKMFIVKENSIIKLN